MQFGRSKHSSLSDEEESQSLTGKRLKGSRLPCGCYTRRTGIPIRKICVSAIVVANILLFLSTIAMTFMSKETLCSEKEMSSYSPIFDRLGIYRSEYRHNYTNYWWDNKPSIFQQRPSPEVDEAWERLTSTESIALNTDEVRKLGYDPETVWPAPTDEFGEGVYYGVIDVFHQMHCLNMLRKTAWPAYYGDIREKTKHTPLKWEDHMLHCTYAVLRSLMCHADVEVIVGQKFKGWPGLNLNFASTKKCRNFQDILEWKEANTIHQKAPWSEYPNTPIIEQDPQGILTPYGNHLGLEDWAESQGIDLEMPSELAWQPKKSNNDPKGQNKEE